MKGEEERRKKAAHERVEVVHEAVLLRLLGHEAVLRGVERRGELVAVLLMRGCCGVEGQGGEGERWGRGGGGGGAAGGRAGRACLAAAARWVASSIMRLMCSSAARSADKCLRRLALDETHWQESIPLRARGKLLRRAAAPCFLGADVCLTCCLICCSCASTWRSFVYCSCTSLGERPQQGARPSAVKW